MDTPGIGGSKEVTQRLMEYLPNAVSFIFVIDVSKAGGMQIEKVSKNSWQMVGGIVIVGRVTRLTKWNYASAYKDDWMTEVLVCKYNNNHLTICRNLYWNYGNFYLHFSEE